MPRPAVSRLLALASSRTSLSPALPMAAGQQAIATLWTAAAGSFSFCPPHCTCHCSCSSCSGIATNSCCRQCTCAKCSGMHMRFGSGGASRGFATLDESQSQIDAINDRFVEAREEISIAQEDAETTYFDESHAEAKKVVEETLGMFNDLLNSLDEADRGRLQRQMGMKMEQLKAELQQLDTLHE